MIQILGNQPKLAFDFVSVFQTPDVSLTSSGEKDAGVLPAARGEFLQTIKEPAKGPSDPSVLRVGEDD